MYEDHTELGEPDNFRYASYDAHTMHHTTQYTMHHTTQHTMHHTTQHMAQHAMRRTTLHTTNHTTKHDTSMMHHTTQHPILSSATLPFATRKENRFSNEKKRKKKKNFFFLADSSIYRMAVGFFNFRFCISINFYLLHFIPHSPTPRKFR